MKLEKGACPIGEAPFLFLANHQMALFCRCYFFEAFFHLMLHPMEGNCPSSGTGAPISINSATRRRSEPVTGMPFPGREWSNWPRYTHFDCVSKAEMSGVQAAS